jgi:hypothetical protein
VTHYRDWLVCPNKPRHGRYYIHVEYTDWWTWWRLWRSLLPSLNISLIHKYFCLFFFFCFFLVIYHIRNCCPQINKYVLLPSTSTTMPTCILLRDWVVSCLCNTKQVSPDLAGLTRVPSIPSSDTTQAGFTLAHDVIKLNSAKQW